MTQWYIYWKQRGPLKASSHICSTKQPNNTCYQHGLLQSVGQDNSGKYLYMNKIRINLVVFHHIVLSLEWAVQQTHSLGRIHSCILLQLSHPGFYFTCIITFLIKLSFMTLFSFSILSRECELPSISKSCFFQVSFLSFGFSYM